MPKITIAYGSLLILVGLFAYFVWGDARSMTALIPAYAGALFLVLGIIALRQAFMKHAMHLAAALSLVLFLATFRGLMTLPALLQGEEVARPLAVQVQSVTAVFSFIFVVLCIADFVRIRRLRKSSLA